MQCTFLVGRNKKLDNFSRIFLNAYSSSFIIHDRENNKIRFIYLFIDISPFNWKIEKKQILVLWLGRVPRDKSGMVNALGPFSGLVIIKLFLKMKK
jgi:hypothetical protein